MMCTCTTVLASENELKYIYLVPVICAEARELMNNIYETWSDSLDGEL